MGTPRRVTDAQVKVLRSQLHRGASLCKAAMKANMDRKSARKYRALGQLPSEACKPHTWRTRPDPLAAVWPELAALLKNEPGLLAKTLWEWLQQAHPGKYPASVRRTLERRVRQWKAQHGPAKEIFFAQEHPPGRLAASDFTSMNEVQVTIQGEPFDHLVYHFVLTHSNWEHVTVCPSESFASLSSGWQNAVWALGAVPERHRTDRMTLAVHQDGHAEKFTANYQALLSHYGVSAEATNPYSGHENGDVESAHGHFKKAVAQALLLRGSRDFASRVAYEGWLRELVTTRNGGRIAKVAADLACCRPLPAARLEALERTRVRVSRMSTIRVKHNTYSVPARLIGEEVEVRIGMEEIEVWYAQQVVLRLERLRGQDNHRIDYRHVIGWLVRKPGAFARYVYRADLYPTTIFRRAYDALVSQQPGSADKEYVRLLHLASQIGEGPVEGVLAERLRLGQAVSALAVEMSLGRSAPATQAALVSVAAVDLQEYDSLLGEPWVAAGTPWTAGAESDNSEAHGCMIVDAAAPLAAAREEPACRLTIPNGNKEVTDELRERSSPGEGAAGIMPGHDAGPLRGGGPSGDRGVVELRDLSLGAGAARVPAAPPEAHRALAEGVQAAPGKELANVGPQAFAAEGSAAVACASERRFSGPAGECAGLWAAGIGQDACVVRRVAGAGALGPAGVVHEGWPARPGAAGGQARPAFAGDDQTPGPVGSVVHRRPGLCATKPRGDGGVIHAFGRALRARQRPGDQQSAVLEVGTDLQGFDDGGSGDRPPGASQRDCRDERAQLPDGESEEAQGDQRPGTVRAAWERWSARGPGRGEVTAVWGPGSAPGAVAALRLPPLRQDPTPPGIASICWGKIIVAKGER